MLRYVISIFREDLVSWVPIICVVACVTLLVGLCANQFIWTTSASFAAACAAAGLDVVEFQMVAETIYVLVALLAFFSLTVVGAATVDRTRMTFAQWRLMGASPSQVRRSMWVLVGMAAVAGSLLGSALSVPLSGLAIPVFNEMAAQGFAGGLGSFVAPRFIPSASAWGFSFLLGVLTCMLGAIGPSLRAARVKPVWALRLPEVVRGKRSVVRWVIGGFLMAVVVMVVAALGLGIGSGSIIELMANTSLQMGIVAAIAVYVLGPSFTRGILTLLHRIFHMMRMRMGVLAARSASSQSGTASAVAPLAAALGGSGALWAFVCTFGQIMHALGDEGEVNFTDTLVMIALVCFVALITSAAVMTLSGRDAARQQALLRSIGMSRRGIMGLACWKAALLAITASVLALIPLIVAEAVIFQLTPFVMGYPFGYVPWAELLAATFVVWMVLYLIKWRQLRQPLRASPADGLRGEIRQRRRKGRG